MHTNYKTAFNLAVEKANASQMDVGLECVREFGHRGYVIFFLPRPENRTGRELTCEVVHPGTPAMA